MTNIHWRDAVDGKFSKAANWRGKEAPGASDNAILDASGSPYTVIYRTDLAGEIGGVRLESNATLNVEGRGFSTSDLVNAGSIVVKTQAGGALGCDTLMNTGTIRVDSVLTTDNPGGYRDINYNGGSIEIIGAHGQTAEFTMMGDGTLSGGGSIRLENGGSLNGGIINNVDNTISGDGEIYAGLVNEAAGLINASDSQLLTIASNNCTVINDGVIETTSAGGALIDSQLNNVGEIRATSGALTLAQRVIGNGVAVIDGGTIDFVSLSSQAVTFASGGTLELGKSRQFTSTVTGFSSMGETTLDLDDIRFVDGNEATFSGTESGGVLTVTDGTHTAHINLVGDYLGATFVASRDDRKGVDVIATGGQTPSIANFVSTMAGFTGHGAEVELAQTRAEDDVGRMTLFAPRPALA